MSSLSAITAELQRSRATAASGSTQGARAPRTVTLTAGDFCPTWHNVPASDVIVGIRVYSEADARTAESEADKQESESAAQQVLFTVAVARGICDPNNLLAPHPLFPLAEDTLPMALTPRAMRRLFDEIERLHVDQSAVFAEATDDECVELAARLINPGEDLGALPAAQQKRARRYLRLVLDLLSEKPSA